MTVYRSTDTGELLPQPVDFVAAALRCGLGFNACLRFYRELGGRIRTQTMLRYWRDELDRRRAWDGG